MSQSWAGTELLWAKDASHNAVITCQGLAATAWVESLAKGQSLLLIRAGNGCPAHDCSHHPPGSGTAFQAEETPSEMR